MERKIGEVFIYEGKAYQVVESYLCEDCAFNSMICGLFVSSIGNCNNFIPNRRTDNINVIFKEIKNMEIKDNTLTIEIPEGMEIDMEHSDLAKGIIKFKNKNITYDDILQAYATDFGKLIVPNHCIDKLLAISRLMNIAKYYNGDWKPDWEHREIKYYIYFDNNNNEYDINYNDAFCRNTIYFKNSKDAKAVINNPNFRDILDAIYKN